MKWSPISIPIAAPRCYAELERLGAQMRMTGADPAAFADIANKADIFTVGGGSDLGKRRA